MSQHRPAAGISLSLENRPAALDPSRGFASVLELAHLADEAGFDAVWVNDSLVDTPGFEPLVTLGAVAAVTRRVRIGTGILQPHFRNAALLALAWATLDQAAGGRTILGLGIGGGTPEHLRRECELMGIQTGERGQRLEETVALLRREWSTDAQLGLPVVPIQERVPIWIASGVYIPESSDSGAQGVFSGNERGVYRAGKLERVARLADGWMSLMLTPDEASAANQRLDEACLAHGREPKELTRALEIWINVGRDAVRSQREVRAAVSAYFQGASIDEVTLKRWAIAGESGHCNERLAEFRAAGIDHFKLVIGAEDVLGQAAKIAEEILPAFP